MRVSRRKQLVLNLYMEHDAAMIARLTGNVVPHCDGLIVKHGRADDVLAATLRSNPLADSWLLDLDIPAQRIVTWSGTLAEKLFDPHPMTWLRPGQERFRQFCDELVPQLRRHDRVLCFQPHSRHVLSDVQSCVKFLQERQGEPFEIALSPATMFEPAMMCDVEDHLRRMFETLGHQTAVMMLADVRIVSADENNQRCESAPLGDGLMPRDALLKLIDDFVPPQTPTAIKAAKISQQLEWLAI